MDNWVAIPLTSFLEAYGSNQSLQILVDSGGGGAVMDAVSDELRVIHSDAAPSRARRSRCILHRFQRNLRESAGEYFEQFWCGGRGHCCSSLVISGIVIMNIMLVSVTERTREIGVRKALGARRRDILLQFLIESAVIAALGGVIGVALGISGAKLVTLAVGFPSMVALWSVLVALFVATAVGLFFGIYPAHKASALDPITALRAEM